MVHGSLGLRGFRHFGLVPGRRSGVLDLAFSEEWKKAQRHVACFFLGPREMTFKGDKMRRRKYPVCQQSVRSLAVGKFKVQLA